MASCGKTYRDLVHIIKSSNKEDRSRILCNHLLDVCGYETTQDSLKKISNFCRKFVFEFQTRWQKSGGNFGVFNRGNNLWLNKPVSLPSPQSKSQNSLPQVKQSNKPRGRPKKVYEEASARSKRRLVQQLHAGKSSKELLHVTSRVLRLEGQSSASKLIMKFSQNPAIADELQKCIEEKNNNANKKSPQDALCVLLDAELSKRKYQVIRDAAPHVFPPYNQVRMAKEDCYPKGIVVLRNSVTVSLQSLVDHTNTRLLTYLDSVLCTLPQNNVRFLYKYGCDGSGDHSLYKLHDRGSDTCDKNILIFSLCPVRLVTKTDDNTDIVIWRNPAPSSSRFCRPIKLFFAKEEPEFVKEETRKVKAEVEALQKTVFTLSSGKIIEAEARMQMTMNDEKICSILLEVSSYARCNVCNASPKQMNHLKNLEELSSNPAAFEMGCSVLHDRIRFMECVFNIGIRKPVKKWSIRNKQDKKIVEARKETIQQNLVEKNLYVGMVKSGGTGGSTNDGNTARKFFEDPATISEITGVDVRLLRRFSVLLNALNSGFELDLDKLGRYCKETREMYVELYPWYYMPSSVHKVLFHSVEILRHGLCPSGEMSEEAQESRHKDVRKYRREYTRKCNWEQCNRDLFNRLLLSSDPMLSSLRKRSQKSSRPLSQEVLALLTCPVVEVVNTASTDVESSDTDA